jgi:5-methyltetrahydropteroyltriglutamate--homocysteine methyltransferase
MSKVKSSNLGYPRIGVRREWKKSLEQLWAGKLEKEAFLKQIEEIRLNNLQTKIEN